MRLHTREKSHRSNNNITIQRGSAPKRWASLNSSCDLSFIFLFFSLLKRLISVAIWLILNVEQNIVVKLRIAEKKENSFSDFFFMRQPVSSVSVLKWLLHSRYATAEELYELSSLPNEIEYEIKFETHEISATNIKLSERNVYNYEACDYQIEILKSMRILRK